MGQLLELGAGERLYQVLGHTANGHDIGQVDFGRGGTRELDLGFLGSLLQALHGHGVAREVGTLVVLELLYEPVDNHLVEVVTAQVGVAVGGEHFKHTATELEDGDIKRTATEVEHGNLHVLVGLVHTISQGGCGGLVHDALHVQTGNLSGLLRGLALRVGEVGGNGNHRVGHLLAEIVLGGLLHLLQHHGRNFLWSILAAVDVDTGIATLVHYREGHAVHLFLHLAPVFAHEALDAVDGVFGVGDSLALGGVAHLALATLHESNDRRRGALAFAVGDYNGFVAFEYGNA